MLLRKCLRLILMGGLAVVGVGIAGQVLAAYQGPFKSVLVSGIALACMTPAILWEMFFPPVFDLTLYSGPVDEEYSWTVDYEFRDPRYAAEFAALNSEAVKGDRA